MVLHYIHIQSDHPPSITKQRPGSLEKQHLASYGYNEKLTYQQQGENIEKYKNTGKNRKHDIIWLNQTYSKLLKRNISKYFLRLFNKHFPPGHKLYKIFNKNTLKLSYSCLPNLKAKIDGHYQKILENTPPWKTKLYNYLKKENCLMRGACLTQNVLYNARISCDDETCKPKLYKEIKETTFRNSEESRILKKYH